MLVRVLKIHPCDGKFRFGGGQTQPWVEVDWFRDDEFPLTPETEYQFRNFIEPKDYNDGSPLLVLHPEHSFTINYETP